MGLINKSILEIQPSQFYLSKDKIDKINQWFDVTNLSNFEPVTVIKIDDNYIFTDGHTRAFVAYMAGLKEIPIVYDEDSLDLEAYHLYTLACKERNITNISMLKNRILTKDEYYQKWLCWCNVVHEVLQLQRSFIDNKVK